MFINWTTDVFINPVTFAASATPPGIPIPTYGNYGGPDYSDGMVGGSITSGAVAPKDNLDALFYAHDLAYQNSSDPATRAAADLTLIQGIETLTAKHQLDAEASFYGGAAILGVAASMALNGHPLSAGQLVLADAIAIYDIRYGLSHFNSTERTLAANALQNIVTGFAHSDVQVATTPTPRVRRKHVAVRTGGGGFRERHWQYFVANRAPSKRVRKSGACNERSASPRLNRRAMQGSRQAAHLLTRDEARRIACQISRSCRSCWGPRVRKMRIDEPDSGRT